MKKITIALLASVAMLSCSKSNEDVINEKIKTYVAANADDPASYEPIETKQKNTLSVADYADMEKKNLDAQLHDYDYKIRDQELRIEALKIKGPQYASFIPEREKIIAQYQVIKNMTLKEVSELEPKLKDTTAAYKVFTHKYRLKNKLGALVKEDAYVITNLKDSIVAFNTDFTEAFEVSMKDFKSRKTDNKR